jgi:hypothetical protein
MIEGCRNSPKLSFSGLFREFRRGKDDLRVRKDDFDAIFFLLAIPRLGESESQDSLTRRVTAHLHPLTRLR